MNRELVLDASVALKWFTPSHTESDVDVAKAIRTAHEERRLTIVAPEIFFYELLNVLVRRYHFSAQDTKHIVRLTFALSIITVSINQPLTELAIELMNQYGLSFYDAMYFAVAQSLDIDCVTADEKAYQSVRTSLPFVKLLSDYR